MTPPCCLCPPGCAGVDGEPACVVECAVCLHGCPAPAGEPCCEDDMTLAHAPPQRPIDRVRTGGYL